MAGYEDATGDLFANAGDEVHASSWMLGLRSSRWTFPIPVPAGSAPWQPGGPSGTKAGEGLR